MKALGVLVGILLIGGWLAGLTYPLLESTEGRYASVSEAMVRTGNWLDPQFNGMPHFTKPPLAYWAGAASMKILGKSEFAVRLPATLALGLCVLLVHGMGKRLGLGAAGRGWAAVMAATAPLAVAQGRMTTSDIFLWVGVLVFYLGAAEPETRSRRRALGVGLGLGWGFLAKGPVILLWTLLPMIIWRVLQRFLQHRDFPPRSEETAAPNWSLGGLRSPLALATALGLGLFWYVVEVIRHPDLVGYWLGSETADRFLTTTHGRDEPFWYFAALLPGVILPWIPEVVRGVRKAWRHAGPWAPILLWVLVPVIFLSFSGSKRVNYLLPAVAPLALLGGLAVDAHPRLGGVGRRLKIRAVVWIVLVLASPLVFHLGLGVPSTRDLAQTVHAEQRPLVLYRTLPSSLPFYLEHALPAAGVHHPSPFPGKDLENRISEEDLGQALSGGALLLTRERDLETLTRLVEGIPVVIWEHGGSVLLGLP